MAAARNQETDCVLVREFDRLARSMRHLLTALEPSLISERVTAGMSAAQVRGRHLGRPATPQRAVGGIEALATSTDLSVRAIQRKIAGRASRGIVGEITKRVRAGSAVT